MKVRHAIIADDLTGAMDAAAAFARRGLPAALLLDPGRGRGRSARRLDAAIVALCTHSRHDPPAAARRKIRRACGLMREAGLALLYKKIDSSGQGGVVAEVQALCDAAGFAGVVVCPAHPRQGRRVRSSILRVRGAAALDLGGRYRAQGLRAFEPIRAPASAAALARALGGAGTFFVADASHETHLASLVRAATRSRRRLLLAGSAAMADALAQSMKRSAGVPPAVGQGQAGRLRPLKKHAFGLKGIAVVRRPLPSVVVAGSANPVTKKQLSHLGNTLPCTVFPLARLTRRAAAAALAGGRHVVILAPVHRRPDRLILRQLGALAPLFRGRLAGSLVVTGGDTAALVCRRLRALGIAIAGEISPGLAWGRLVGGAADGVAIGTKPGGFGGAGALAQAVKFLGAAATACSSLSPSCSSLSPSRFP